MMLQGASLSKGTFRRLVRPHAQPDGGGHTGGVDRTITVWVLNRTAAKHDTWEVLEGFSPVHTAATDDPPCQVHDGADGGRLVHRGRGFGPVAVTSRCGTQSSTW
jgi:hypothetical protein